MFVSDDRSFKMQIDEDSQKLKKKARAAQE